jgi:hypothetical protein
MGVSAEAASAPHAEWQCPTCRLAARGRGGMLSLPNNPLVVAAVQAICAGGASADLNEAGWRRDRCGAPIFEFWSGSGGRIKVTVEGSPESAWRDVCHYDADVGLRGRGAGMFSV